MIFFLYWIHFVFILTIVRYSFFSLQIFLKYKVKGWMLVLEKVFLLNECLFCLLKWVTFKNLNMVMKISRHWVILVLDFLYPFLLDKFPRTTNVCGSLNFLGTLGTRFSTMLTELSCIPKSSHLQISFTRKTFSFSFKIENWSFVR